MQKIHIFPNKFLLSIGFQLIKVFISEKLPVLSLSKHKKYFFSQLPHYKNWIFHNIITNNTKNLVPKNFFFTLNDMKKESEQKINKLKP